MGRSKNKKLGKNKLSEVNTFPIPCALREVKENITIITDTSTKLSKKQIIDQAFKFHSQGNILEAVKYYQQFINYGYKDQRVFSNYGVILRDLGKLKEAEILYRKAIELNPAVPDAYSNLGNILRDHGELQEAELVTSKAIQLNPDFAEAHSNLGNILRDLGQLEDAEISYRKAIKIKPNFAEGYSNLGNTLRDLDRLQEAFNCYLRATKLDPNLPNIYTIITRLLRDSDPSLLNRSKLKNILNLLLEKNDINHKELFKVFKFLYGTEIVNNQEKIDSDFSKIESFLNEKLITNALKKMIFKDIRMEKMLTKIRRKICYMIANKIENFSDSKLQFLNAIGEQCFLNEYVYSLTEKENSSLNIIINRCIDGEVNETNISILSCYFPLYKLLDRIPSIKSFNSTNQSFKDLIKLQVLEPLKEIELSKNIKKLGSINDNISKKVKSQYEENPYPRWRYGNTSKNFKISATDKINSAIKPNFINQEIGNDQLKILIAGCGTGQHILNVQQYKNAKITGIDLSLSSLAYAQRKINELEINNVELIQMDILKVGLLEEKFDIIESSGVLHHMNEPIKGLNSLLDVLKDDGYLKLGLYSELARQDIIKARNYIAKKQIQPNRDNIHNFRQEVISGELTYLNSLDSRGDFYSLSQCRDLCFHFQEHRFTIHQLEETLDSNKLKFLGFFLTQQSKSLYQKYFPEDKKQTNLQNWAKFEEKHPHTFRGMYQFWVCKKKI